jgi:hypothetical protein
VTVANFDGWIEEALARCDAAVLIGGSKGALRIARTFIDAGKPVFPIPFVSGGADEVFRDLVTTWSDSPVPGLTRNQFLSLALPWNKGTGPLVNLLLGTLSSTPDIFISYRRTDAALAAGRLHSDLSEHFGTSRVFMDLHALEPTVQWRTAIDTAVAACRIGVIVIGDRWLDPAAAGLQPRINDEQDYVRREIRLMVESSKPLAPVLVGSATNLPLTIELPSDIRPILEAQVTHLDNSNWDAELRRMIKQFEITMMNASARDQNTGDEGSTVMEAYRAGAH